MSPFNSAMSRRDISKPLKNLITKNLVKGSILDFGCGRGFDSEYLKMCGYEVISYDKYHPETQYRVLPEKKSDTAICIYVFNVIDSLQEHQETLELLKSLAKNIYIAVRSDYKEAPKTAFQRFYNKELISELFGEVQYISVSYEFILFKLL